MGAEAAVPPDGGGANVPAELLASILEKGRRQGWLSIDDLEDLLREIDLTMDRIDALRSSVLAEGIRWVEDDEVDDDAVLEAAVEAAADALAAEASLTE